VSGAHGGSAASRLSRPQVHPQGHAVGAPERIPPRLLTPEQAAEILAVRPVTVRSWMADGRLPRVKIGRSVRVPLAAVTDFIVANTTPALPKVAEVRHEGL